MMFINPCTPQEKLPLRQICEMIASSDEKCYLDFPLRRLLSSSYDGEQASEREKMGKSELVLSTDTDYSSSTTSHRLETEI